MAVSKREEGGSRKFLPLFFTCFFSLAAFRALFFELGPALRDHRIAQKNLELQMQSHRRIVDDVKSRQKKADSLLNDPQSIENALDEKGILPPKPSSSSYQPGH